MPKKDKMLILGGKCIQGIAGDEDISVRESLDACVRYVIEAIVSFVFSYVVINVLRDLGSPWYVWIIYLVIVIADIFATIEEAYCDPIALASGYTLAGIVLEDVGTIIVGVIAVLIPIIGWIKREGM